MITYIGKNTVPTAQGKLGKWQKKFPVRENTGNLEMLLKHRENTGNLVCSSCKFSDSKGERYFEICCEILQFFLKLDKSAKSVFLYVTVTNHVKWHSENLTPDREKMGKTQGI